MFISNENRKVLKIENDARTQHITIEENDTGEIKVTGVGPDLGDGVGYGLVTIIDDEVTTEIDPDWTAAAWVDWSNAPDFPKYSWKNPSNKSVTIIFDGETYENVLDKGDNIFGAAYNFDDDTYDWSKYPFEVGDEGLATKDAGEHTVKVIAYVAKNKIPIDMNDYPFVKFTDHGEGAIGETFECNLSFDELESLCNESRKVGFSLLAFYDNTDDTFYRYIAMDLLQQGMRSYNYPFVFAFHDYSISNNVVQYKEFKQLTFKPDGTITVSTIS